jgi:hypothetical protein
MVPKRWRDSYNIGKGRDSFYILQESGRQRWICDFLYVQDSLYSIGADVALSRRLGGRFAEDVEVTPGCFGTLQVRSSSFLLTCGHWDNSFKVISLSDGRMVQSNRQHTDIVTCLSGIEMLPRSLLGQFSDVETIFYVLVVVY